jgi:PrtD family type I secretion system ABC transporter
MQALTQPPVIAGVFRQIRPPLIAAGGLSLFINLLVFVSPLYSMQIYDRIMTSRNATTLLLISFIALILFCSYAALEHYRSRVLVQAGIRFDRLLSGPSFETALSEALRTRGVHNVQILLDVDTVRDVLSSSVTSALMDVPWTPVFLGICFLLHPWIGVVALFGALAIIAVAMVNERATKGPLVAASFKSLQALDRLTCSLRNAEAIRALGMGSAVRSAWSRVHREALGHSLLAGERGGSSLAVSKFLRMTVQTAVMGVGAYLVIKQEISAGVLFAASLIMGRALAPVEAVVAQWKALVSARTAFARLHGILQRTPAREGILRVAELRGEISVENLTVCAPSTNLPVLADVTLKLNPGEIVAIIGHTGSGKSSLARALVGVWPTAHGCVRIDGYHLRHLNHDLLGRSIGYLPQDVELFAGTVRDNIGRFRSDATDEQVIEAAMRSSAHEMIQQLSDGYGTCIGDDGAGLSGGQRQRIGLARALFGKPVFIVLDEPNANLDTDGDIALAQAMQRLRSQNTTVVIVTHRPNLLSIVDRIVFMHAGRIKRVGARDELLPLLLGDNVAPAPRRVASGERQAHTGPARHFEFPVTHRHGHATRQ